MPASAAPISTARPSNCTQASLSWVERHLGAALQESYAEEPRQKGHEAADMPEKVTAGFAAGPCPACIHEQPTMEAAARPISSPAQYLDCGLR